MNSFKKPFGVFLLFSLSLSLNGCGLNQKLTGFKEKANSIMQEYKGKISGKVITLETKEVSIGCDRGDITEYTKKGWKIISSNTKEVTCTWKTVQATAGCNLKRDKGCSITVPDKTGEETTYLLEKEIVKEIQ